MSPVEFRSGLRRLIADDHPAAKGETTRLMLAYADASPSKQAEVTAELRRDLLAMERVEQ